MLSGIVDNAVQTSKVLHGGFDRVFELGVITHVTLYKQGFAGACGIQFLNQLLSRLFAASQNGHQTTFATEDARTAFTDALAATGDDDNFVFESHFLSLSICLFSVVVGRRPGDGQRSKAICTSRAGCIICDSLNRHNLTTRIFVLFGTACQSCGL
jgi:hypothetical protein